MNKLVEMNSFGEQSLEKFIAGGKFRNGLNNQALSLG
jgi:hypothetical protein